VILAQRDKKVVRKFQDVEEGVKEQRFNHLIWMTERFWMTEEFDDVASSAGFFGWFLRLASSADDVDDLDDSCSQNCDCLIESAASTELSQLSQLASSAVAACPVCHCLSCKAR